MREGRNFIPTVEWEDARQVRGMAGERVAWAFLTACGWNIEAHRFRWGRHDLDLIARREHVVAFVEVKTRRSLACGTPVESIGWRKRLTIGRLAELWRLRYGRLGDEYRFDVVAVRETGRGRYDIEHVADAWRLIR
jgi:putative endonuclease